MPVAADLIELLAGYKEQDEARWKGGQLSGAVYHGEDDHLDLLNEEELLSVKQEPAEQLSYKQVPAELLAGKQEPAELLEDRLATEALTNLCEVVVALLDAGSLVHSSAVRLVFVWKRPLFLSPELCDAVAVDGGVECVGSMCPSRPWSQCPSPRGT